MSGTVHYSTWLQAHALDDSLCAGAYEAVGAQARSTLKLCIARLHAFWGESPVASTTSLSYAQGFSVARDTAPAPYVLVFCPVSHANPAHLLAVCLPAILAGVPLIVPCLIAENAQAGLPESANGILAALELAGLEQAVAVNDTEALEGIALLYEALGAGRIAVLGEAGFGETFALAAHRLGIPLFNGTVARAAGDAALLSLDEAHTGIWVWPDLGPEWFRSSRLAFAGR
jgi:histidinol dehydrogenase